MIPHPPNIQAITQATETEDVLEVEITQNFRYGQESWGDLPFTPPSFLLDY